MQRTALTAYMTIYFDSILKALHEQHTRAENDFSSLEQVTYRQGILQQTIAAQEIIQKFLTVVNGLFGFIVISVPSVSVNMLHVHSSVRCSMCAREQSETVRGVHSEFVLSLRFLQATDYSNSFT
jgi:hypothetical protein